jgi:trigger factor
VNVSVENLGPCKKLLRVEVPAGQVDEVFEEITRDFSRKASLPGFRPGKAPKHLVVKSFGSRIIDEVKKKILTDSFRDLTAQHKIINTLDLEELQFGRGEDMQFTVTVECAPEFPLPNYKGLRAQREMVLVNDEDVERAINILRDQTATYKDLDRPLAQGDYAVLNIHISADGKPLAEAIPAAAHLAEQKDIWVVIKPGSYAPGFTEQIEGASSGDKRTFSLKVDDSPVQEINGRELTFDVEILKTKEKVLPELTDEYAGTYGADSLAALLDGVRRDIQREREFQQNRSVRDQLLRALLDQAHMEIPEDMLQEETRQIVYQIVSENQKRQVPNELIEQKKDEIYQTARSSASDRVRIRFIVEQIAKAENITVKQDDLIKRIAAIAQESEMTFDKAVKLVEERKALPGIQRELLLSKVLEFITLNSQIEEVVARTPSAQEPIEPMA